MVLGEYAVLDGAPGLVAAVNRRVRVQISPCSAGRSVVTTRMPRSRRHEFETGEASGLPIVDAVRSVLDLGEVAWEAEIDSSAFFDPGGSKLGLGSSAAVICALAGAARGSAGTNESLPPLSKLLEIQRLVQGGGSGIDLAASLKGGVLKFRADGETGPNAVRLGPDLPGYLSCVFTGASASTPRFLTRYRQWRESHASDFHQLNEHMTEVSRQGCTAVETGSAAELVRCIRRYGQHMAELGAAIGLPIVTEAHARLTELAEDLGGAYKPSGAGGGDIGLGCFTEREALLAFSRAADQLGFAIVRLAVDPRGLNVDEGELNG